MTVLVAGETTARLVRSWWVPVLAVVAMGALVFKAIIDQDRIAAAGRALPPGVPVGDSAPACSSLAGSDRPATNRATSTGPATPANRTTPAGLIPNHGGAMRAVAIHPDGHLVAVGDGDAVALWTISDPSHPRPIGTLLLTGDLRVVAVAIGMGGRLLAVGCDDRRVSVFDVADPAAPRRLGMLPAPCGRFQDPACALAFAPDGRHLVVADRDAVIWDMSAPARPRPVATLPLARRWWRGARCAAAFTMDGRLLALASRTTVTLWEAADPHRPKRLGRLRPYGHSVGVNSVGVHSIAFSPDGNVLATASHQRIEAYNGTTMILGDTGAVDLWDITDPVRAHRLVRMDQRGASSLSVRTRHEYPVYTGHDGAVQAVAYSPDGHRLATAGADRVAVLWDVTVPTRPRAIDLLAHHSPVDTVAFSPDGRLLVTGCRGSGAAVWHTQTHHEEPPAATPPPTPDA